MTCSATDCIAMLRSRNMAKFRNGSVTVVCPVCANNFARKASQVAKYKTSYCSKACRSIGVRGPKPTLVTGWNIPCRECGTEVWRTPASIQPNTYCSIYCATIGALPGRYGPRIDRIVKPCTTCRKPMRMIPSKAKRYKFCSLKCAAITTQSARRGLPGNEWSLSQRYKLACTLRNKWRNEWSHRACQMSVRMRGRGNPQWRDGRARRPYTPGFTRSLKWRIAKRDLFLCRLCGEPWAPGTHAVHHIDGTKHNHAEGNLILLCRRCHGKVHQGLARIDQLPCPLLATEDL